MLDRTELNAKTEGILAQLKEDELQLIFSYLPSNHDKFNFRQVSHYTKHLADNDVSDFGKTFRHNLEHFDLSVELKRVIEELKPYWFSESVFCNKWTLVAANIAVFGGVGSVMGAGLGGFAGGVSGFVGSAVVGIGLGKVLTAIEGQAAFPNYTTLFSSFFGFCGLHGGAFAGMFGGAGYVGAYDFNGFKIVMENVTFSLGGVIGSLVPDSASTGVRAAAGVSVILSSMASGTTLFNRYQSHADANDKKRTDAEKQLNIITLSKQP